MADDLRDAIAAAIDARIAEAAALGPPITSSDMADAVLPVIRGHAAPTRPEPAPTDNAWLGMDGGYVHRPTARQHVCELPAEWTPGATWRCPDGHLWAVDTACGTCKWLGRGEGGMRHVHTIGHAWWPATRWQRIRARWATGQPMRRAEIGMAGPNRVQASPKGAPPGSPSLPDYDG